MSVVRLSLSCIFLVVFAVGGTFSLNLDDISFTSPPCLEVRDLGSKGRGVFALCEFEKGQIVEVAPVLLVDEESVLGLHNYIFSWPEQDREKVAIGLGYTSLYNHDKQPNTDWYERTGRMPALIIEARKAIHVGDELTYNYRCGKKCDQEYLNIPCAM
eukprot:CAMPEP_0201490268 /NCGR_PEP_ID=MMETSP0151_2-20130828/25862_1 /ASSEMBLY_ACC=CAM_ASM_000257 /TAXON_ID=200890 /ORGANISM="Paramoeba atlantica, Strain 621/1 / CCAP 1560/9" /LENGTH=157 /DNA_ID=CAMNT_0047876167 /DNA_START=40 /DNA_END=513 /DNA_ORIENTATION=-